MQTSLLMDGQIIAAQQNAREQQDERGDDTIPNFDEVIIALTNQAQYAIDHADRSGQGSWTDYYRLVSQTAFIEQRLKAPFVFEKPQFWKERSQLVNGLYGVSAHILHEAIREYDRPSIRQVEEEELRGVIQEQTFMALFNREQQRKRIAMPSATYADLRGKVDADVWVLADRQTQPFYLPVQIKTTLWADEEYITPDHGITIISHEYDNDRGLKISRLIAKEYRHIISTGDPLNSTEEQLLLAASDNLFMTMEYKAQHPM